MRYDLIKRICIIILFFFSMVIIFGFNQNPLSSQYSDYDNSYYTNTNNISNYRYYKDVEVDYYGRLIFSGRYDNTLGEFLHAINSQHVYKVGYDSGGELVRYFRGNRIYTPTYYSMQNRMVKEISISVQGTDNDKVRVYEYSNGMLKEMQEFFKKVNMDRMEINLIKNQSVTYYYNNMNRIIKEEYHNFNESRKITSKSVVMNYSGGHLSKKEYFDENGNLEYYYQYGNVITQHKPDGELVREIVKDKQGEITTEYYPPIMVNQGQYWEVVASEKYPEGVEIGYLYQNGIIYRFQRLFPKKNGFAKYDYTVMQSTEGQKVVMENVYFTQYKTWRESSTIVQRVYAILYHNDKPYTKELSYRWISKDGKNLMAMLPFQLRNRINQKDEDFIGAEYIILAKLKAAGDTTLAEVLTEDGQREWCDIIQGYIFFIATLSHGGGLDYNKIRIKSKGYYDMEFEFEVEEGQRLVDLGEIYLSPEE
jgi:hypothetical protein